MEKHMQKRKLKNSFSVKHKKFVPNKPKNKDRRAREYLTYQEIEKLRKSAKKSATYGHRNDTIILMMFRHALRVGEVVSLQWNQIDFKKGLLHVNRIKNGTPSTHPLRSIELRALRKLQRENENKSPYIFITNRGTPITTRTIHYIIARAGEEAGFDFSIHPHMLRHSAGFYLANNGHDTRAIQSYFGHASINHTVRYTELSPHRFKDFWKD
jgi:site-specific recombinase XerD